MQRLVGFGIAACCAASLLVGTVGSANAQSVTPSSFTKHVCAAVATAQQASKPATTALKEAGSAYKAAPSATTATALRDALTQAASTLDQQTGGLLTVIQQTGTPTGAADFVNALVAQLGVQRTKAQQLAQNSAAVDTSTSAAFTQGFQQVIAETKTASAEARASAKSDPAFKHAQKTFRPLVRFLTTDADTCAKV